jgi:DnaK suppressor protein
MTRQQLLRKRLVALVDALLARYEDQLLPDPDAPDSTIGEELQVQIWDGHRLPSLSDDHARAVDEIVDVLRRIGAGAYGRCVVCGVAVGFQRLHSSPTARMCEECASDEQCRPLAFH